MARDVSQQITDIDEHRNQQDRTFKYIWTGVKEVPTGTAEPIATVDAEVPPGSFLKVNNDKSQSGKIFVGPEGVATENAYEIDSGEDPNA